MKPTKEYNGRSRIRMFNVDCMDFMEDCDKYDLAIVDPPYGIGMDGYTTDEKPNDKWKNKKAKVYKKKDWDELPTDEYFNKLFKASDNQIIWGGNYFNLPPSGGWVVWDKKKPENFSLSQAELAWVNNSGRVSIFRYLWNGFQKERPEFRFHPTQKPVQLYKWLLTNYAKEGDTIFDSHGGSMSIAIACWDLGFDLDIIELDEDYFNDAVKRFETHIAQTQLF